MRKDIVQLAKVIRESVEYGGKILVCGNGGSCNQSDHFAGELINDGIPCIPLTNSGVITAIGNDYGFEHVFEKQVVALGRPGDILICLTTSNDSVNIRRATRASATKGMRAYTFTHKSAPKDVFTTVVPVNNSGTQGIQEDTLKLLHRLWKEI